MTEMIRKELKRTFSRLDEIEFLTEKQKNEIQQIGWNNYYNLAESMKTCSQFVSSVIQPLLEKNNLQLNISLYLKLPEGSLARETIYRIIPEDVELTTTVNLETYLTKEQKNKIEDYIDYRNDYMENYAEQDQIILNHIQPFINEGDKTKLEKLVHCLPETPTRFYVSKKLYELKA